MFKRNVANRFSTPGEKVLFSSYAKKVRVKVIYCGQLIFCGQFLAFFSGRKLSVGSTPSNLVVVDSVFILVRPRPISITGASTQMAGLQGIKDAT